MWEVASRFPVKASNKLFLLDQTLITSALPLPPLGCGREPRTWPMSEESKKKYFRADPQGCREMSLTDDDLFKRDESLW